MLSLERDYKRYIQEKENKRKEIETEKRKVSIIIKYLFVLTYSYICTYYTRVTKLKGIMSYFV